jgi:hypothetical protein
MEAPSSVTLKNGLVPQVSSMLQEVFGIVKTSVRSEADAGGR